MTQAKYIETYAEYRIILVEDGSVDTDDCKELGFRPLVYRKGAALPMILKGDKT